MSKVFQKVRTGITLGQLAADPSDPQLVTLLFGKRRLNRPESYKYVI